MSRPTPFFALVIVVMLVVCGVVARAGPRRAAGVVAGTWDAECEAGFLDQCDSEDAAAALEPVENWRRWRGEDVIVHVRLVSHFNARLPGGDRSAVFIENGGRHGTSFASDVSKIVEPLGEVAFDVNARQPEGVPRGTPIIECSPTLYDADLIPVES